MDGDIVPQIEISASLSSSSLVTDVNGNAVHTIVNPSAEYLRATLDKLDGEYKLVMAENRLLKDAVHKKDELIKQIKAKFELLEAQLKDFARSHSVSWVKSPPKSDSHHSKNQVD